MKERRKTYIYKWGQYVTEKPSASEAADYANVTHVTVSNIIRKKIKANRNGWTFSYEPLSLEEMEELQRLAAEKQLKQEKKLEKIKDNNCVLDLGVCRFDVDCKDGQAFYIPRSKDERKNNIMQLYLAELRMNQGQYTKEITAMKRENMRELLNSV